MPRPCLSSARARCVPVARGSTGREARPEGTADLTGTCGNEHAGSARRPRRSASQADSAGSIPVTRSGVFPGRRHIWRTLVGRARVTRHLRASASHACRAGPGCVGCTRLACRSVLARCRCGGCSRYRWCPRRRTGDLPGWCCRLAPGLPVAAAGCAARYPSGSWAQGLDPHLDDRGASRHSRWTGGPHLSPEGAHRHGAGGDCKPRFTGPAGSAGSSL